MKRVPIISVGQVYLHGDLNQYLVVTKSTGGDVQFRGIGFSGMNEAEVFLGRFLPVDPCDLSDDECIELVNLLPEQYDTLLMGWIHGWTGEDEDEL